MEVLLGQNDFTVEFFCFRRAWYSCQLWKIYYNTTVIAANVWKLDLLQTWSIFKANYTAIHYHPISSMITVNQLSDSVTFFRLCYILFHTNYIIITRMLHSFLKWTLSTLFALSHSYSWFIYTHTHMDTASQNSSKAGRKSIDPPCSINYFLSPNSSSFW